MAAYNKFEGFVGYLGLGTVNLNTDVLKAYLTNAAPSASADDVIGDLAEITAEHGYSAGGADTTNTYSEANGTGTLAGTDIVWTAVGGSFGPFRYVVLYDDTHASDILIAWWDYGASITVLTGETFTVDFGASLATIA
ncbi:MAG: hypothetical protein IMZ57_02325 [Acidobacteria bacterium]|nr:hypothetical protein [Acidobacteriota bacterium]